MHNVLLAEVSLAATHAVSGLTLSPIDPGAPAAALPIVGIAQKLRNAVGRVRPEVQGITVRPATKPLRPKNLPVR